jgi:hypothetical protein
MDTTPLGTSLATLFAELTDGAPRAGGAFILNSGDVGLARSLDALSAADASRSLQGGATVAAHARHLAYGLSLMNRWARDGGNPFADATWDAAWKTTVVTEEEWSVIRSDLREQSRQWTAHLAASRDVQDIEWRGMIASIAHLAYHLGAIRQIAAAARGPREGTLA